MEMLERVNDNVLIWENQQRSENFKVNNFYKDQMLAYLELKLNSINKKDKEMLTESFRHSFITLYHNLRSLQIHACDICDIHRFDE